MDRDDIAARFITEWRGFSLDVDLRIPGKGVTAIFGPSGSGKTTLIRCIAGLERMKTGFFYFKGEVWQDETKWLPPHKRPIGFVFQEAGLFTHLTVKGNLQYGMKRNRIDRTANLDAAVDLLGIGHLLARKTDRLSGGERQRVGIARALSVGPRILLMDEPLAALDLARKKEIMPYLDRLHRELDIPILYVTHSPDEVARLADHLVCMDSGRISASGPLAQTLARLDLPIRLGEDVGVVLEAEVAARDERWHLTRLDFSGGSLWTRDQDIEIGRQVRVRVLARDVSLAMSKQNDSSILNSLLGKVDSVADDEHPGLCLVRIQVGSSTLIARLTKRSVAELGISPGISVMAQIKSVALIG